MLAKKPNPLRSIFGFARNYAFRFPLPEPGRGTEGIRIKLRGITEQLQSRGGFAAMGFKIKTPPMDR